MAKGDLVPMPEKEKEPTGRFPALRVLLSDTLGGLAARSQEAIEGIIANTTELTELYERMNEQTSKDLEAAKAHAKKMGI